MREQSKRDSHRGLLESLEGMGLTEYGCVIEAKLVHELLGIEQPPVAAKAVYDRLAMTELAAIDYCRSVLLSQGRYLQGTASGYRVLLPSENKQQVNAYMSSADRKLNRALKLSRNTPGEPAASADQTEVRILMKQSSHRRGYATPGLHAGLAR
jgi:hypothetical protein